MGFGTHGCIVDHSGSRESEPALIQALAYSLEIVRRNMAHFVDFPEFAAGGQWHCITDGGWVGGHWVGLLWLASAYTGEESFGQAARQWASRLRPRQHDNTTHDLGFLFQLSHVLGAQISGDESLKVPALVAAETLSRRFNPRGRYLQAWGEPTGTSDERGRTIIDALMNLELLYWASDESGNPQFADMATQHAQTALARLVRPDGSTAHAADFDPDTGAFFRQATRQGHSATSCWSRGQAWAVYGFAGCYHHTGDVVFLRAARMVADYALQRLPSDHVPYWDYTSPLLPHDFRDSSAASILAAGLLHLEACEPDPNMAMRWHAAAQAILQSLWDNYSSRGTAEPCILLHATQNKRRGSTDQGLIYGDYYFVEALVHALGTPGDTNAA